jgi:RNA polymerase sigma-70 factor (ECF subfamily)
MTTRTGSAERFALPTVSMDFDAYRPLLFGVAYRMTGSAMEAEDLVQEAWLRVRDLSPESLRHPKAYLVQVVTRLALDYLKSARVQREQYIGPWLPEPILTDPQEPDDTLSLAFLTLLERINPLERAVFLLREVFDYDYADIVPVVERSEASCRQLFRRAKLRLAAEPRFHPTPESYYTLLNTFTEVMVSGDLERLETLLAEDITVYSDGGGKVVAARKPLVGPSRVANFFRGLLRNAPPDARVTIRTVNDLPALLLWVGGELYSVMTVEIVGGRIATMRNILNPDKLRHIKARLKADGSG